MGTRTVPRSVIVAAIIGGVLGVAVVPAGASPAKGCAGSAVSFDGKGRALDKVTAPGAGGTAGDPFHIDVNGNIDWSGSTTQVLQNGHYSVKVAGFNVASGAMKNATGTKKWAGHEDVGNRLSSIPVLGWLTKTLKPTATLKADYKVTGNRGGVCTGSVVLKIGDDPLFTPIWFLAAAMFLIAFWLLFFPRRFLGE